MRCPVGDLIGWCVARAALIWRAVRAAGHGGCTRPGALRQPEAAGPARPGGHGRWRSRKAHMYPYQPPATVPLSPSHPFSPPVHLLPEKYRDKNDTGTRTDLMNVFLINWNFEKICNNINIYGINTCDRDFLPGFEVSTFVNNFDVIIQAINHFWTIK